ncbi:TRAP transporter small permease [Marinospirillum minutulum]|uniref:TRAP transporter small permease n=1 Tax=Marinospirillum minutulum TaxID=64974 RepID=UPI000421341D|nr:TRAP transporter small permease subunit [Marinospirillum minutulum]
MLLLLKRLTRYTDFMLMLLASIALFSMMLMTFSDVMMRSLFNAPIQVSTELTRVFMAIMVFSSLPVMMVRQGAISVDLLDTLFRSWGVERVQLGLIDIFIGIVLYWPVQRLWVLVERTHSYGEVTEFLRLPQYWVLGFITFAVAITAIATLVKGLLVLFGKVPGGKTNV